MSAVSKYSFTNPKIKSIKRAERTETKGPYKIIKLLKHFGYKFSSYSPNREQLIFFWGFLLLFLFLFLFPSARTADNTQWQQLCLYLMLSLPTHNEFIRTDIGENVESSPFFFVNFQHSLFYLVFHFDFAGSFQYMHIETIWPFTSTVVHSQSK